jgi:DNA-binding FrmR family transcriptional regulator
MTWICVGNIMAHTIKEKTKLLARVRRIRGQVEALERALESEKDCVEVLQQIAAARGAINGLMVEVVEDHIRTHVASPAIDTEAQRRQGVEELIDIIRAYLK